jgi:hypothetical protein
MTIYGYLENFQALSTSYGGSNSLFGERIANEAVAVNNL